MKADKILTNTKFGLNQFVKVLVTVYFGNISSTDSQIMKRSHNYSTTFTKKA